MKKIILLICVLFSVVLFGGTLSFGPDGGEDNVSFWMDTRLADCEVNCPYFVSTKIERYYNEYRGEELITIRLYVEQNRDWRSRTGKLLIRCGIGYYNEHTATYTINQSGYPPCITPSSVVLEPRDEKCSFSVKVNASVNFSDYVRTDSDWIKVPTKQIYINDSGTTFAVDVCENMLKKSRTGSVLLAGEPISITQEGQLDYTGTASAVTSGVKVRYGIYDEGIEEFFVDDEKVFSSEGRGAFTWQPQKLGSHKLVYTAGGKAWTNTLNVTKLAFATHPEPDPPMAKNSKISITPTTRDFEVGGGGAAIITSGSGSWTAAVSDPWITLNATSGSAGYPVAYTVSANTNVEMRVGYVYVSGYTHTVTQAGLGADVDKTNIIVENGGGSGNINVTAQNRIVWQARPNVDWISVSPTSGSGEGSVGYHVAPYNEVATRQGTMTVAGNTVTVFQYGRRMKLESYSETRDWYTHVIPITVNALAITEWSVTPNASWISIVDAGNGKGGDLVSIAIAENPSYKARTGTVTIGTEIFTVTQEGRTDLAFSVSPVSSEASVEGAYGLVAVTATPDLPWTAKSGVNWVTLVATTASGAGNGNIVYSASPNSTLYNRTGTITVTPDTASGMPARTHTVTQPAAVAALSLSGYEFVAAGESCAVEVSVADIVEWEVNESLDWLTVNGSTSRTGPGVVTLQASANNTIYPRSGTVTIARKTFTVTQKARGVEVEYDSKLFGTDGGMESISIHPDGNSLWTAVASDPTWITIFQGDSGTGDGEIMYIVSPYVGDGSARTGWITVGDKTIYITQRAYDLSISPNGKKVTGNNGAGEIGVSASIGDVWNAIVTEPWITIVDGYDSGTGSGTVRFIYTENNTGKTRVGKIIIAGEVYTLEQAARMMVNITATAGRGGKVSGGGSYDLGSEVTLTAIPDDGYKFSYWTGDVSTMQNPIKLTVYVAKSVSAVFEPLPIAFESVTSGLDGVRLSWNNLAWATTYRIYRGVTSVPSSATQLAEIVNTGNCTYLDESGVIGTTYWYWIEAEGAEDSVMSDPMTGMKEKPIVISPITYQNLRGATHTNPESYQEGTLVSFSNPSGVTGYTFAGWIPSQITTDMTGAQTVRANWTANSYTISYNANGGNGTMGGTSATYDSEVTIAENGFTRSGYIFKGWATEEGGAVVYASGQQVTNLTSLSGGDVTLYAVWEEEKFANPIITPGDGSVFKTDTCMVTITCATPDVKIYYTTNGRTPSVNDRYLYQEPFTISETTTVIAFSVKNGKASDYVEATITYVEPEPLTLKGVLDEANLVSVETGGVAEWMPIYDEDVKVGDSLAISGAIEEGDEEEHESWIRVKVNGKGSLSFWWRVDCEPDPGKRFTWDRGVLTIDGKDIDKKDGITEWMNHSVTFDTAGEHEIVLTYISDGYLPVEEDVYAGCMWADGFVWEKAQVYGKIVYENLKGATHTNPNSYREGTVVSFASPSKISDYTFVGWTPSQITADMTGDIVVIANWEWAPQDTVVEASVTGWKPVTVKSDWVKTELEQKFGVGRKESFITKFGDNLASAMTKKTGKRDSAGNELLVWHDYVAGTDPTDINSTFKAKIEMQDGKPVVSWEPNLNSVGEERVYTVHGKESLSDIWHSPITALDHFFKVDVAMPREGTVTFDVGGGLAANPISVRVGQKVGELPIPTREGYTFLGWFTSSNWDVTVTSETIVTADMTVYARWRKNPIANGHEYVQLWEDGPYWATTNIGAEKPEDYGYYFWWGDTVGYKRENDKWIASDGSNSNFSFSSGNMPTYNRSISTLQNEGWITSDGVLATEHDAAHKHWGGDWRMPTEQEFDDLNTKCNWTRTTMNGVNGYDVRGKGDYSSKSIFLPCAGFAYETSLDRAGSDGDYWSSVPDSDDYGDYSWYLGFNSGGHNTYCIYRDCGRSVRPLLGFTK